MGRSIENILHINHFCDDVNCHKEISKKHKKGWENYNEDKYLSKKGWAKATEGYFFTQKYGKYFCPKHAKKRGLKRGKNLEVS